MSEHETELVYPKADNGVFTLGVVGHCSPCDWFGDLHHTDSHGHLEAVADIAAHVRDANRTKESAA